MTRFTAAHTDASHRLLNSERIKLKFGSYSIDVLKNTEDTRISNLYSLHNGRKITRTVAVVTYPPTIDPFFEKEHRQIIAGKSIGTVFSDNGWEIEKKHLYFGNIDADEGLDTIYQLMGGLSPAHLAVHIYELCIEKHGEQFVYGIITEIHHPEYLNASDLKIIFDQTECAEKADEIDEIITDVLKQIERI